MSRPSAKEKKISYVLSTSLINSFDKVSVLQHRASMVHCLLESCGLLAKFKVVQSSKACEDDIRVFHSEDYIDYIKAADDVTANTDEEDSFGLGFDCPAFKELWPLVQDVAGATLTAAEELLTGKSDLAVNWYGGWHHAQRDSASGFCYVNDVVLAIQKLRKKFDKVLYIDLDIHHGDGVENAFLFSPKVLTFSLHQQEPGFFPGTGFQEDIGLGNGTYYSINIPYKSGLNDKQLIYLLENVIYDIFSKFKPDAIVCQCGADALAGDPLGGANITLDGYLYCIREIMNFKRPTLFLGGGGYNKSNAAKLWTAISFTLLNESLPEEIPEHKFFPLYGPDFRFNISAGLRKSENTESSLNSTIANVLRNLQNLRLRDSSKEDDSDIEMRIKVLEENLCR